MFSRTVNPANWKRPASTIATIRDGEGALIINSRLVNNRIAIHYSQPSMRTQWMMSGSRTAMHG